MPSVQSTKQEVELTPEQLDVVNTPGSLVVIGNPGAGKTTCILNRLLRNNKLGLSTLVLVFTNVAKDAVLEIAPWAEVHTVHSYCYKYVGWKKNYPDLLYRFVLSEWKDVWDEVIVDEGQDLSPLELDVIDSIPKKSLFLVLDPFQSIYIGDWARNYLDLPAMGKDVITALKLPVKELYGNFRSNSHIVGILEGIYKRGLVPLGPTTYNKDAIYTRTHSELKRVSDSLSEAGISHLLRLRKTIPHEEEFTEVGENPKLELMVMHCCKGKQFDRGFIFDWNGTTEEDYNLLYTTTARSSKEVYCIGRRGICQYLPAEVNLPSIDDMISMIGDYS